MVSTSGASGKRYASLDLLRGAGIWMIVLYHVYKNVFALPPESSVVYRSLYFTTGYFVFSVGLVLAVHYFPKMADLPAGTSIFPRLCARAMKLVAILVAANIFTLFLSGGPSPATALAALRKIGSLLYTDRWDVSYQVLLPIGATLVAGYFFLILLQRCPRCLLYSAFLLAAGALAAHPGDIPYFWRFSAYGIFGVACGYAYINGISSLISRYLVAFCAVLGLLFVSISLYSVSTEDSLSVINNLPLGLAASSAYTLFAFILLENLLNRRGKARGSNLVLDYVMHIGKNSLFYYILQGFLIIVVSRFVSTGSDLVSFILSVLVLLSCSLLYFSLNLIRTVRTVDVAYRFLFQ